MRNIKEYKDILVKAYEKAKNNPGYNNQNYFYAMSPEILRELKEKWRYSKYDKFFKYLESIRKEELLIEHPCYWEKEEESEDETTSQPFWYDRESYKRPGVKRIRIRIERV